MLISPSILAADFSQLRTETEMLNNSEADFIHIDLMDGVFVPNISFGFPVTEAIFRYAETPLDFHLMLENPDPYLQACHQSGADIISVHYEACRHLHRTVQGIKELGIKAGVAINPHTPVSCLSDIILEVDVVLIMSVNPGFGGQRFLEMSIEKVSEAKELILRKNSQAMVEVDGGVNLENGALLKEAGADILVAGSSVFKTKDPSDTIKQFKTL